MEMNVSKNDEQVVARKAGGLNPAVIIPILFAIGVCIYLFVLVTQETLKMQIN
jgi:biopolymer transport protein ExbB